MNVENGGGFLTSRGADKQSMKHIGFGIGVLGLLVALCVLAAGGAVADTHGQDAPENGSANGSFGAEVSSFMQASTADAQTEVEAGMFQAAMQRAETAEERRELVAQRQERLAQRQAELGERRAEIDGEEPNPKNRALATRVSVGADGLERAVDETEAQAHQLGLDTETLNEIRTNASSLKGDVADLARDLGGQQRGQGQDEPNDAERGNERGNEGEDARPDDRGQDGDRGNSSQHTVPYPDDGADDSSESN